MQQLRSPKQPWITPLPELLDALGTNEHGLTDAEARARLASIGTNAFRHREKKSAASIFLKQLASPLIFILIGVAVITVLLNEWIEFVVVTLAVLVNSGLGFYREYHAEHTLEKLSTFIKDRSRIVRDGYEQEIDSELIVPGDIVMLAYGARVPADARIMSVNNFSVNESILTGESTPIHKAAGETLAAATIAERTNMVHAGTLVVDGYASVVVVATGNRTEIGKIAGLVSGTQRAATPIQRSLSTLAWIIFAVVLGIVGIIFALGISSGQSFIDMLILSAAVSVGAVPEALPIALTVILSTGAERIAKKGGVARTLLAAETLGSTSLIMTDKTGTLTEANMKLVGVFSTQELERQEASTALEGQHRLLLSIALSNINVLIENPTATISQWVFKGKPFEVNIAKAARESGIDISTLKAASGSGIVIPFNSTHKFSVSHFNGILTVMGAPDILLARSSMPVQDRIRIEAWITQASGEGKRLIALGQLPHETGDLKIDDVRDIRFSGILAFHDPVREQVPVAIHRIEQLGIKVVMITGDLKGTAISVAKEIGWNIDEASVLTGHQIQTLTDDALKRMIPDIKIFARVTPEDKMRIGNLYRELGEVVAMTGDGVNDAPALKAMDIGVALGSGSDVAKSAADLVLVGDDFEAISLAVLEGRRILSNIRKTFVYLMSNSLDEICVITGSLVVGVPLPLTALQIIWVNLFTGSLPALSFAYDQDFDHVGSKRHTLKSIFSKEVNVLTFGVGIVTSVLLFVMYYLLITFGVDADVARSVFFACFASYILVIAFSFRSLYRPLFSYPVFSNRRLNQSILLAALLLIATLAFEPMRSIFELEPIPTVWLGFIAGWLTFNVLLVECAKWLFRLHGAHKRKQ